MFGTALTLTVRYDYTGGSGGIHVAVIVRVAVAGEIGHQNMGIAVRGSLLRLRIVHQSGGDLGTGGIVPGRENAAVYRRYDAIVLCPCHGGGGIAGDQGAVAECRCTSGGTARIAPENRGHILTGHWVIGAEDTAAIPLHQLLLGRPEYRVAIPRPIGGVSEVIRPGYGRLSLHSVEHRSQRRPGERAIGIKAAPADAVHQLVLAAVLDGLGIWTPGVHIGISSIGFCGKGWDCKTQHQQKHSRKGKILLPFLHIFRDLPTSSNVIFTWLDKPDGSCLLLDSLIVLLFHKNVKCLF